MRKMSFLVWFKAFKRRKRKKNAEREMEGQALRGRSFEKAKMIIKDK